jgi:hypothetical protein
VVLLLVLLGHKWAAAVLLVAVAVASLAASRIPAFASAMTRFEAAIRHWVGRALGLVLMGVVHVVVFWPAWLLLRVLGVNPIEPGGRRSEDSFWLPSPARELYRRPFAYERLPAGAGGRPSRAMRLRAAIGLVVILILVDIGVGAVIDRLTTDPPAQNVLAVADPHAPAGTFPGWQTVVPEVSDAIQHSSYDPYLSFKLIDYDGRYVNVHDGVRKSYEPANANAPGAITVGFFGASAAFGAYQRDEHTIPSEFARLAEADGVPVRVINYGQPGWVNWQEVLLLQQLASRGDAPDLAVFYDGFNELLLQFTLGDHTEPTQLRSKAILEQLVNGDTQQESKSFLKRAYSSWAQSSAIHRLGADLGVFEAQSEQGTPLQSPWTGAQSDHPGVRAVHAMGIYRRGLEMAEATGEHFGFRTAFFWQPSIYTKRLAPGEQPLEDDAGYDPDAWRKATRVARSQIRPPITDLGASLDGLRQPVMFDVVHTNEAGARAVAEQLYERLRPELRRR